MNKEELIDWIDHYSGMGNVSVSTIKKLLNEFFDSNVCIPKGENRHPYADVLHAWIEDTTKELQANYKGGKFVDFIIHYEHYQYRIKPSEPVYEWKYSFSTYGHKLTTDNFMTDEEARKYQLPSIFSKIEETKRVRQ